MSEILSSSASATEKTGVIKFDTYFFSSNSCLINLQQEVQALQVRACIRSAVIFLCIYLRLVRGVRAYIYGDAIAVGR